jgi:hypothetical protein
LAALPSWISSIAFFKAIHIVWAWSLVKPLVGTDHEVVFDMEKRGLVVVVGFPSSVFGQNPSSENS